MFCYQPNLGLKNISTVRRVWNGLSTALKHCELVKKYQAATLMEGLLDLDLFF